MNLQISQLIHNVRESYHTSHHFQPQLNCSKSTGWIPSTHIDFASLSGTQSKVKTVKLSRMSLIWLLVLHIHIYLPFRLLLASIEKLVYHMVNSDSHVKNAFLNFPKIFPW